VVPQRLDLFVLEIIVKVHILAEYILSLPFIVSLDTTNILDLERDFPKRCPDTALPMFDARPERAAISLSFFISFRLKNAVDKVLKMVLDYPRLSSVMSSFPKRLGLTCEWLQSCWMQRMCP
jgi:hypothetical protein